MLLSPKCYRWQDPYTLGRGNTIYSLFVGHIQSSLPVSIGQLEAALEFTIQAGDRISTILNFGVVALLKFFASEHMSELELFCQYGPEEVITFASGNKETKAKHHHRYRNGNTISGVAPSLSRLSKLPKQCKGKL